MDENKNFENEENGAMPEEPIENEEVTAEEPAPEYAEETAEEAVEETAETDEAEEPAEETAEIDESAFTAEAVPAKKSPIAIILVAVLVVLIIAAAVLTTMVSKGIASDNKLMQGIASVLHMNKYNKDYVDVTGKTVTDLAESQGMELSEFLTQYQLPADMPANTTETAAYYTIPVKKMAEMYKMDFATLKEVLKFPDTVTEDTSWGDAEGQVKVGDYVGAENIDAFKQQYGLGEEITADTLWKDVRNTVDESQKKQRIESEAASAASKDGADAADDKSADKPADDAANADKSADGEKADSKAETKAE